VRHDLSRLLLVSFAEEAVRMSRAPELLIRDKWETVCRWLRCSNFTNATGEWVLRSVYTEDITPVQGTKPPSEYVSIRSINRCIVAW